MATDIAKRGVQAGIGQLRETEISSLAQTVRACNIAVGIGLLLGSGLLTLYECIVELWLCDQFDNDNRCVQQLDFGECETAECALEIMADSDSFYRCQLACGLGSLDVMSTVVLAVYMLPLGAMVLTFELTRGWEDAWARRVLAEYFGFMFLYKGRMLCLLFAGLLALGNVTQNLDGNDEIYHWGGLFAGLAAFVTAVLHLGILYAHPDYDREMILQQERLVAMRQARGTHTAGGGGGVAARASSLGSGLGAVGGFGGSGGGKAGGATPASRQDVGERAAAAVEAARALSGKPPAGSPAAARGGGGGGYSPTGRAPPSLQGVKRKPPSLRTAALTVRATTPPRAKRPPPPLTGMRP
jgi:hypothetical protein